MDVDEWRAQFSARLRAFGDDLLEHTHLKLKQIPPASLAYSLAVVIDKLGHLEGRNQVANAAVNMQVNNYFGAPGAKEMILSELDGSRMKDAISASTKPMQTFPSTNKQCDPEPTEQTEDSQSIVI